ncbi:MAG: rhodanese-like domain-containing protein [Pyrinomonadaceae bacterium]|nr:rhodanese-like domain-containing protein [Pyrinomonadaceae bacterium]
MSECTVLGLQEQLVNGEIHLVDVRERMEFAGGRVSGASSLPLSEIEERHAELDHSKPIYVMCRTGRRSGEAQKKLKALGFTNVINVVGGIEAWKKEALPVERDEHAPWSIERQVRFTAGLLVFIGAVLSLVVHPYFVALSGFVGFGLAFSSAIDWCGMGLLMAKMPWNRRSVA